MDIEGFVAIQKDLLRREYETELEQAGNARNKFSGGELQRMGKALLGLRCEVSTGTFGRFILSLKATSAEAEKAGSKRMIPPNKFSVGSVVHVTKGKTFQKRTKRGKSEDDRVAESSRLTGVVSRQSQVVLKIMVDSNTTYDAIDEYRFCSNVRIDLMPDKETYRRLCAGLDRLLRCPRWASNIVAPLFRHSAFDSFTSARNDGDNDDKLIWLNSGLNESQRRAVRMCMSVKDVAFVHGPPGETPSVALRFCACHVRSPWFTHSTQAHTSFVSQERARRPLSLSSYIRKCAEDRGFSCAHHQMWPWTISSFDLPRVWRER